MKPAERLRGPEQRDWPYGWWLTACIVAFYVGLGELLKWAGAW